MVRPQIERSAFLGGIGRPVIHDCHASYHFRQRQDGAAGDHFRIALDRREPNPDDRKIIVGRRRRFKSGDTGGFSDCRSGIACPIGSHISGAAPLDRPSRRAEIAALPTLYC